MIAKVKCAKLGQELPAIDPAAPDGDRALKMALLIGGPQMRQRIAQHVSAQAWDMWLDHMRMVLNEFRLDPTSDEANRVLARYMEEFFFGGEAAIPNYVPPGTTPPDPAQGA
jgi:Fe-S cluster biosynthesis and repair protein YggX